MTGTPPASLAAYLQEFQAELLRWNQRINLVSRQNTAQVLQALFQQCVGGAEALWATLSAEDAARPLLYFDLGSGGGLPGVVWHRFFWERRPAVRTWLVEPREKRAWFLERLSGLAGAPPWTVVCARWGESAPLVDPADVGGPAPLVLISLKALHLTDPEVLAGLAAAWPESGPCRVVIARYYPPRQVLDPALRRRLLVPEPGAPGAGGLAATGAEVLDWGPDAGASLVVSRYA